MTTTAVSITGSDDCIGALAADNAGMVTGCNSSGFVSGNTLVGGLIAHNHNHGFLTDCYTADLVVEGKGTVGGLVGFNESGIQTCHATGSVTGDEDIGGLVGHNRGGLTACYATGEVECWRLSAGGLVGTNSDGGILRACYAMGSVTGGSDAGGLVGYLGWASGRLDDCYAAGSVAGSDWVAGLVGYISSDSTATLRRCFAVGLVTGSGHPLGGLVADDSGDATDDCFWDMQTSGQATSSGGTGKTTAEMQTATTFLEAGWDFVDETANGTEDIWWILEGQDYPRLWWELISEK